MACRKLAVGTKTKLPNCCAAEACHVLDIEYSITQLAKTKNSEGSKTTKAQRLYALCAMARTLVKDLPHKDFADATRLMSPRTSIEPPTDRVNRATYSFAGGSNMLQILALFWCVYGGCFGSDFGLGSRVWRAQGAPAFPF